MEAIGLCACLLAFATTLAPRSSAQSSGSSPSSSPAASSSPGDRKLPIDPSDPKKVNFTMTGGAIGANIVASYQIRGHRVFADQLYIGPYDSMKLSMGLLNLLKNKGLITKDEGQAVIDGALINMNDELAH